ncbi:MAG: hypothetical protein JWP78_615 [Mucilaginibacter sp.]|nr:hypothetical protein [Mucilaginibacter sp.]
MQSSIKNEIRKLEDLLNGQRDNFPSIEQTFINHCKSDFLQNFIKHELVSTIHSDFFSLINHNSTILINSDKFEYLIFIVDSDVLVEPLIWMELSQIWVIKGNGYLRIQILQLPEQLNINFFEQNVEYKIIDERTVYAGESISCSSPFQLIRVIEISNQIVIERLNIKYRPIEFYWKFNEEGKSALTIINNLNARILNVIDLKSQMNIN